jgi:hypothetical protein
MAVTPANLAMGPGSLYVGLFGAPEPLDVQVNGTPAVSAWTDVGGTLGGLKLSVVNTFKELEVDQLTETPERRRTKKEVTLSTQLAEVTFTNLILTLVGGTVTDGGASHESYEPDNSDSSTAPQYSSIIFDGVGGAGKRRRVFMRKCLSTENVDVANSKEDQTVYPVTFTTHYVSPSIRSWRVVNSKT